MNVFASMRCNQAFRFVPGLNWWNAAYALTDVSWTRSSASVGLRVIRRAAMYNCPRTGTTSRSNRSSRSGASSLFAMVTPLPIASHPYRRSLTPKWLGFPATSTSRVSNPVLRHDAEGFLKICLGPSRRWARRRCARAGRARTATMGCVTTSAAEHALADLAFRLGAAEVPGLSPAERDLADMGAAARGPGPGAGAALVTPSANKAARDVVSGLRDRIRA